MTIGKLLILSTVVLAIVWDSVESWRSSSIVTWWGRSIQWLQIRNILPVPIDVYVNQETVILSLLPYEKCCLIVDKLRLKILFTFFTFSVFHIVHFFFTFIMWLQRSTFGQNLVNTCSAFSSVHAECPRIKP